MTQKKSDTRRDARLRHRGIPRGEERPGPGRRRGRLVSCAASPGSSRTARSRVGRIGQQPAGEILQADGGGPEAARGRNSALEAHVFRNCADSGARLRRTYGARVVDGSEVESKGAGDAEKAGARPGGGTAVSSGEAC